MGWLSRRSKNAVTASPVEDVAVEPPAEEVARWNIYRQSWLRSLTPESLNKLFMELDREFDHTATVILTRSDYVESTNSAHRTLRGKLGSLKTEFSLIDMCKLSDADALILYDTLVYRLPAEAQRYSSMSFTYGMYSTITGKTLDMQAMFAPGPTRHYPLLTSLDNLLKDASLIRSKQWSESYAASLPKPVLLVPAAPSGSEAVTAALSSLDVLWRAVVGLNLDVADRFFVDEVAARYFPDAWSMFQSFVGRDESLLAEAEDVFLEQVGLMARRLQTISSRTQQTALGAFKAHSSFLREVTSA